MYEEYFGLEQSPFHITPDPDFIFMSKSHRDGFNHLLYGLRMKKGFLSLLGEVGTGKTTLYRFLLRKIGDTYPTAVILNPLLTGKQLIRSILQDFDVSDFPSSATSHVLFNRLNQFLKDANEQDRTPLLVVDEAHQLPYSLLEQIRILSNFETNRQKLLQILLVGQPELLRRLSTPSLRQLNQRINVRYSLGGLNKVETQRYIEHRLSVAGNKGRIEFSRGANRMIRKLSRGVPRVINQVCDRALVSAYVSESGVVQKSHVKDGVKSLEGGCGLSPLSFLDKSGVLNDGGSLARRFRYMDLSEGSKIGIHI